MIKYRYEGLYPPTIFTSIFTQKQYIVPAWIEIEPGTTLDEIEWIKPEFLKTNNNDRNEPTGTLQHS